MALGASGDVEHLRLLPASDEELASRVPEQDPARQAPEPRRGGRPARLVVSIVGGLAAILLVGLALAAVVDTGPASGLLRANAAAAIEEVGMMGEDPYWGCGLVGPLPGISQDGLVAPETQRLIDGIRASSTHNMVTYWNWNLAPETASGFEQHLSKDFIFMPEEWGAGPVEEKYLRQAGDANFLDGNGKPCPATMADIFLGMNEPDITGSCMGDMFGTCKAPCSDASVAAGNCPASHLDGPPQPPNAAGECNCWQFSHATGVGFWPIEGCAARQPLPGMWGDPACVDSVMVAWKKTAAIAIKKGYKYLSTPLVAVDIDYARQFIARACAECTDIACGCPVYIGVHFYAYDCQPEALGGYAGFQAKLAKVAEVMQQFPFVKGAIMNEVGMLNCASSSNNPICVPDSGRYPARDVPDHGCPVTPELPDGLATFIDRLFDIVIAAKTVDGRPVVKAFSWFNENMDGGTYNLQLFDPDGRVNKVGEAYMRGCTRWAQARPAPFAKKK